MLGDLISWDSIGAEVASPDDCTGPTAAAVGATEHAQAHSASAMELAAPPAGMLLVLQGLAFLWLIRSRRRWAVAALVIISLGRTGLQALPRLLDTQSETAPARSSAIAHLAPQLEQSLASEAHTVDLDYVWMLRQADSEPILARNSFERIAKPTTANPAKGLCTVVSAHLAIAPPVTEPDPALSCAYMPRESRDQFPRPSFSFRLFSRPPPVLCA